MVQFFSKPRPDSSPMKPEDSEMNFTPEEILVLKKFTGFLSGGGGDFPGMDRVVALFRTRAAELDAPKKKSFSTDDATIIDNENFTEFDKLSLTSTSGSEGETINDLTKQSEDVQSTSDDDEITIVSPSTQSSLEATTFARRSSLATLVTDGHCVITHNSHLEHDPSTFVRSNAFAGAKIHGVANITNHSFNGNANCYIASGRKTHNSAFNGQRGLYWED